MNADPYANANYKLSAGTTLGRPTLRRSPLRPQRVKRIHLGFSLVGSVAGVVGGVYAYNETSSIALPIFVFWVVQSYIGRGLGDVATDPQKGKRFVYFTLQPVLAVAIFYVTYLWWETMWLSAVLGIVIGVTMWQLLGVVLFPEIEEEERLDTQDRFKTGSA